MLHSRLPVPGEGNGGTDFLAAAGFPGKFARLPRTRRERAPCLSLSRERAENRAIVSSNKHGQPCFWPSCSNRAMVSRVTPRSNVNGEISSGGCGGSSEERRRAVAVQKLRA